MGFYGMKFLLLSVTLLSIFTLCSGAWWNRTGIQGDFPYNPQDGYRCSYAICAMVFTRQRRFQIRCEKGSDSYDCVYQGNPQQCSAFENGGQEGYWNTLAVMAGRGKAHACTIRKLNDDEMCPSRRIALYRMHFRYVGGNGRVIPQRSPAKPFCSDR